MQFILRSFSIFHEISSLFFSSNKSKKKVKKKNVLELWPCSCWLLPFNHHQTSLRAILSTLLFAYLKVLLFFLFYFKNQEISFSFWIWIWIFPWREVVSCGLRFLWNWLKVCVFVLTFNIVSIKNSRFRQFYTKFPIFPSIRHSTENENLKNSKTFQMFQKFLLNCSFPVKFKIKKFVKNFKFKFSAIYIINYFVNTPRIHLYKHNLSLNEIKTVVFRILIKEHNFPSQLFAACIKICSNFNHDFEHKFSNILFVCL